MSVHTKHAYSTMTTGSTHKLGMLSKNPHLFFHPTNYTRPVKSHALCVWHTLDQLHRLTRTRPAVAHILHVRRYKRTVFLLAHSPGIRNICSYLGCTIVSVCIRFCSKHWVRTSLLHVLIKYGCTLPHGREWSKLPGLWLAFPIFLRWRRSIRVSWYQALKFQSLKIGCCEIISIDVGYSLRVSSVAEVKYRLMGH